MIQIEDAKSAVSMLLAIYRPFPQGTAMRSESISTHKASFGRFGFEMKVKVLLLKREVSEGLSSSWDSLVVQ